MSAEDGTTLDVVGHAALRGNADRERLFFALWPSRETAMALHALACRQAASTGGRLTRMDSIHLTVAFLGDVPADRIDVVRAPPLGIASPAFAMDVDRVGHWVRNGIVWAGPSVVPDALAALQGRLAAWLASEGIVPDARPFRPHVTLLRKAARGDLAGPDAPIEWQAAEYVLVRSGRRADGSRYETIGRFPLNPGGGNPSKTGPEIPRAEPPDVRGQERESMEKIVKSDEQWRAMLTPEQFRVARRQGTERPFCGAFLDNKLHGTYHCVCCDLPLFRSNTKFESGTGWPSFFDPVDERHVEIHRDVSHGMIRQEVVCARCDGHLGHVFEDGPAPTGLRYCMNSESMVFREE